MKIGLEYITGYLPGETLDVKEYFSYLTPEADKLPAPERSVLFSSAPETVHRLKDPSALEFIALHAAQKALDGSRILPSEIDGLLVAQTGGKQFMPLLASYLQLNLGLSKAVIARNIGDNDISILNIMNLARVYIKSGLCKRVLIVAATAQIGGKYGFGADMTEPWSMHLGDGGGAAIVSAGDLKCEFLGYHMETYAVTPRTTGTLNGDYGPIRMPANRDLCFQAEMDDDYGAYLIPYDPELRRIAGAETFLSDTLSRAAAKAGLALSDIDHIITAHTGDLQRTWQDDLTRAGISPGVFKNLQQETGNTACAAPLIDLAAYAKDGSFRTGDTIAVWIPCTGVQVATILLKWL